MGACCGKQQRRRAYSDREEPLISHEREDSVEMSSLQDSAQGSAFKRLEKNLRFNGDKEVVMEGILTLKKKGSMRSRKKDGFCTLTATTFCMYASTEQPAGNAAPTVQATPILWLWR